MLGSAKSLSRKSLFRAASRTPKLASPSAPIRLLSNQVKDAASGEVPSTMYKETTPATDLGLIKEHGAPTGFPKHTPDYTAVTDYRTSNFSIIPMRVVDGSEPGVSVPAAVVSGAPMDLQARMVRIYKPAKPATQSGNWHGMGWTMDWDPLPKGHRWENPLMGWQSSADSMQGYRVDFNSKEDAIKFAEKQGYPYFVQEPNERKFTPKLYDSNFLYAKKLKHIRTK